MRPVIWLMDRFGVPDALVGDLVERQDRQPSRLRFWRQTVGAILNAVRRDVLGHGALAVRALLVGWTLHWLVVQCRQPVMWMSAGWAWKANLWLTRSLGVYIPVPFLVVEFVGALAIGWTVSRLHRPHGMAMVLVYLATVLVFYLGGFFNSLPRGVAAFGFVDLAVNALFPFVVVPMAVIGGGLVSVSPRLWSRVT
jgi:hypothetical protein